ncbi:MAG: hypothetical protein ACOCVC_05595, partial [Spirochaeta sp.]
VAMNNDSRTVGGSYSNTFTREDDSYTTAPQVTSQSYLLGRDDEGGAKSYPADSDWAVTLLGQLPMALIGESSPITAFLRVGADSNNDNLLTQVRTRFAETTMNDWANDNREIISRTYGRNLSGGNWNPEATGIGNFLDSGPVVTAGTVAGADTYFDLEDTGEGSFGFDLGGGIDPVIPLDERITAFTKGHMTLGFDFGGDDTAEREELRVQDTGAETDWESKYSEVTEVSTLDIDLQSELGGRFAFTDQSGFLTLSTGLFLQPGYTRESTTPKSTTTVTERRSDGTGGTLTEADVTDAGGPAAAAALVNTTVDGRSVLTVTETWEGSEVDSTLMLNLVIPTSVRMDFREGTLSLVGGYNISHDQSWTTTKDDRTSSTNTTAVVTTTNDGDVTVNDVPAASETTPDNPRVEKTSATTPWAGQMSWMVRWMPTESITVDLSGQSVMTALDMDVFGGGTSGGNDGFNMNYIIDSLQFGISFRF